MPGGFKGPYLLISPQRIDVAFLGLIQIACLQIRGTELRQRASVTLLVRSSFVERDRLRDSPDRLRVLLLLSQPDPKGEDRSAKLHRGRRRGQSGHGFGQPWVRIGIV